MGRIAPHQARKVAGSLTQIDTGRRLADTALYEGSVDKLIAQLTVIASEAVNALAELARPAPGLHDPDAADRLANNATREHGAS